MSFPLEFEANLTIVSILFYLGNRTVVSMSFPPEFEANLTIVTILFYLGNRTVVSMSFCVEIEGNLTIVSIHFYLTNRFHVAVRLFSNRSQMTSKCDKTKKVAHEAIAECVTELFTTS